MQSKLEQKMLHYFRTAGSAESEYKEDIPSFVRFAHLCGMDMQSLREACDESESLSRTYRECEEILADRIVDGALHKRLDASFAKFLLTARFGYSEKKEDDDGEFELEILLKEPPSPFDAAKQGAAEAPP